MQGDLIKESALLLLLLFLLMISKRKRLMVESGEEQGGEQRCRRHVGGGEREGIPAGRGDEGDISTVICYGHALQNTSVYHVCGGAEQK